DRGRGARIRRRVVTGPDRRGSAAVQGVRTDACADGACIMTDQRNPVADEPSNKGYVRQSGCTCREDPDDPQMLLDDDARPVHGLTTSTAVEVVTRALLADVRDDDEHLPADQEEECFRAHIHLAWSIDDDPAQTVLMATPARL